MRVMTHFLLWCLGLAEAETQTTSAERDCLARHAAGKKRLVEIGVWHGVTTCRLRRAMAADGVLVAIDPYPVGRLKFSTHQVIAHREVGWINQGRVQWMRMSGGEAARAYVSAGGRPVDFVFIDGDHSYDGVRSDWEGWSPLIEAGGIAALHDSCSSTTRQIDDAGSAVFTRNVILKDRRFLKIKTVDTLTVLQRQRESSSITTSG